mmetsp:Transcript_148963/g.478676  ORF Transcript_148963/g.478676 Transcript_148963/m.478676 type:complete len:205 (-) Transcript_148963:871-1485(-)
MRASSWRGTASFCATGRSSTSKGFPESFFRKAGPSGPSGNCTSKCVRESEDMCSLFKISSVNRSGWCWRPTCPDQRPPRESTAKAMPRCRADNAPNSTPLACTHFNTTSTTGPPLRAGVAWAAGHGEACCGEGCRMPGSCRGGVPIGAVPAERLTRRRNTKTTLWKGGLRSGTMSTQDRASSENWSTMLPLGHTFLSKFASTLE